MIADDREMGLARRACLALRGVQESAVRQAIAAGRNATEADGTIDTASADAMRKASAIPPAGHNHVTVRSSACPDQANTDVTRR